MDLRLAKLPNKTPVKMTLLLTPQLNEALGVYAELYRTAYGHEAAVVDLVPAMLETFLAGDKAFAAARRK